jgi:hypothetical protein
MHGKNCLPKNEQINIVVDALTADSLLYMYLQTKAVAVGL